MDELNRQVQALIGSLLIDKMALELRVRDLEEELRKAREEKPAQPPAA